KIAFLSEDSSYGQGVTESARQRAKGEFGMQEVMLEYYNWQTLNDMTPTILKMKQLNPDIVHQISFSNDGVLFWRQAKEQNFLFQALVHAGASGYRRAPHRPEGQQVEKASRDPAQKETGSYPLGAHQLAGSGLWLLKLVLDK